MPSGEAGILVVGASSPAAQRFLRIASNKNFPGYVEAVADDNSEFTGKHIGDTALAGLVGNDELRIISLREAVEADSVVVASFISDRAADIYEDSLAAGRAYFTEANADRQRTDVAMANACTNPEQIDELFMQPGRDAYIVASGARAATGIAVALKPLYDRWGISELEIETLQGWSSEDLTEVPEDFKDIIVDIKEGQKHKLSVSISRLLSRFMEVPAAIDFISVRPNHAPWVHDTHTLVRATLASSASAKKIKKIWRNYEAPKILRAIDFSSDSSKNTKKQKLIKVSSSELLDIDETGTLFLPKDASPMRVRTHLRDVQEDGHAIIFETQSDNTVLGAAGSIARNLGYAQTQDYLK